MQIIGERINGTRKQVAKVVAERDVNFIQTLARRQVEAGAHLLDVNAGTQPDREPDDLAWLVKTVQAVASVPLSLDSANPVALAAAIKEVQQPPLINSISGEPERLNGILPLVRDHSGSVIALAMDEKGIPPGVADRVAVIHRVIDATRRAGVPDEKVYVDPLVMSIATNTACGQIALDTMRAVRAGFPAVHITSGLSNVSFGLPVRGLINRTFLTLALAAGLDSAIMDPLDRELRAALLATEMLLGRDRHCLNYTRAYRAGWLEPLKPNGA